MAKYLVIFSILIAPAAFAQQQIDWQRTTAHGVEKISVKYDKSKSMLFTNSNALNSEYPAQVGLFERAERGPQFSIVHDLTKEENAKKFKPLMNLPPTKDSAKILFNGKEVAYGSFAYIDLFRVIKAEVQSKDWKLVEGQKVSFKDFRELTVEDWKTNKKQTQKKRMPASICKRKGNHIICSVKKAMIYAPKDFERYPFSN